MSQTILYNPFFAKITFSKKRMIWNNIEYYTLTIFSNSDNYSYNISS